MRRGVRLGVDVGSVRLGVARCDPEGLLATPLAVKAARPVRFGKGGRDLIPVLRDTGLTMLMWSIAVAAALALH